MPGRDVTGPKGMGPMAGKGRGNCPAGQVSGDIDNRCGKARGASRGSHNLFHESGLPGWVGESLTRSYPNAEAEIAMLKDMEEFVGKHLDKIRKRLSELTKSE
jgi:hypothetical protein